MLLPACFGFVAMNPQGLYDGSDKCALKVPQAVTEPQTKSAGNQSGAPSPNLSRPPGKQIASTAPEERITTKNKLQQKCHG